MATVAIYESCFDGVYGLALKHAADINPEASSVPDTMIGTGHVATLQIRAFVEQQYNKYYVSLETLATQKSLFWLGLRDSRLWPEAEQRFLVL